jgi:hypothetical protein
MKTKKETRGLTVMDIFKYFPIFGPNISLVIDEGINLFTERCRHMQAVIRLSCLVTKII